MQRIVRIAIGVGAGVCLLIVFIVLAVVLKPSPEDLGPLDGPWDNIRLPENIIARKYRLSLDINWEKWEYSGTQEVTMDVVGDNPVEYFLIHSKGLDVNKAATTLQNINELGVSDLTVKRSFMDTEKKPELEHDFYVVQSDGPVGPGEYKMKIHFTGKVQTERLTGMYRSKYIRQLPNSDPNSTYIYQIATDFEPVDARSAFPCFDEPAQKASWENDIKVTFPTGIDTNEYIITSNMPLKKDTYYVKNGQTLSASFEESVEMSTYLVCFTVSDFHFKAGTYTRSDESTVDLRVFTRREFLDSAEYALQVTEKILEEYEKFYQVNYPLPKLDQIALPEFNSGAMENWGLITYRESSLLYNKETSSNSEKQRVCAVIAHEIAHQWFGNIVTMAWWNDLWLNEGFASFVEYYGINAAEPDWNILDFFYPDEITSAMSFDSAPSSHPISVNVSSPAELSGLFDTISYRKGSSINWMMQKFMGESTFGDGLQAYIEKYQGKNAAMVDLFDTLDTVTTSINVKEIMMTWTMQMGFPYVDVKLDTTTTAGSTIITLTQNRFLVGDKLPDDESPYDYKWYIPFTFVDEAGTSDIIWMKPAVPTLTHTVPRTLTWIKGNAGGDFYYIVNYEDPVLAQLKVELEKEPSSLSKATDRTSLIYDVFSLASIGQKTYSTALDLTKYAAKETEYVVLSRIISSVYGAARRISDDTAAFAKFKNYVVGILKPRVDALTWEAGNNEPITTPMMRDMALRNYCWAIKNENDTTVVEAVKKFTAFAEDPVGEKSKIKDVFNSVLRTAILYDDAENTNWNLMFDLLQNSEWEADQRSYIAALSKSKDTQLLEKMVEDSFEENAKAGTWRYVYYLNYYGESRYEMAWQLLQKHWDAYAERYNDTSFTMGYLVEIPEVFDTEDKYDEVKAFFELKNDSIGTGKKTVKETLAKIQSNIKWKKDNAADVKEWFNNL